MDSADSINYLSVIVMNVRDVFFYHFRESLTFELILGSKLLKLVHVLNPLSLGRAIGGLQY